MSDFLFIVVVIAAFFVLGIAFGWLVVIARSGLHKNVERAERRRDDAGPGTGRADIGWGGGWTDTMGAGWEEPPQADEAGEDNAPPWWPGGPGR